MNRRAVIPHGDGTVSVIDVAEDGTVTVVLWAGTEEEVRRIMDNEDHVIVVGKGALSVNT